MFFWLSRRTRILLYTVADWCSRHSLGLTITLLSLVFIVLFYWNHIVVSIYPGRAGVLWRRFSGTVLSHVYGEGLHLIWPFDVMYVYDVRWQVLPHSITALTRDGLEITLELALLYRVQYDLVAELHQNVGVQYRQALVIPTLDAAVRHALGRLSATLLYVDRENQTYSTEAGHVDVLERDLVELARKDIGWKYIEVQDLNIRQLVMPRRVQEAIQRKREEEQLALLYNYRLERERKEAERKRIEAQGIRDFQETITGGLTEKFLTFKGIEATLELAKSSNAKVLVFGDKTGLPLLLGVPPPVPSDRSQSIENLYPQ